MRYDDGLPEWLKNPHPEGTQKHWCFEQFVYEVVNDCGASFDEAGNRIRKGKYSDLYDEVQYFRTVLEKFRASEPTPSATAHKGEGK